MKILSIAMMSLMIACGASPNKPNFQSALSQGADAQKSPIASVTPSKASGQSKMTEENAEQAIAQASQQMNETVGTEQIANAPAPTDFNGQVEQQLSASLAAMQNSKGQKLSPEQTAALTASFMKVVAASQSKNPIAMAASFNNFIGTMDKMGQKAQASNLAAAGLISDVLGLAVDIIGLALDLVMAVLALDVAGVIQVPIDLVGLVIDFLV